MAQAADASATLSILICIGFGATGLSYLTLPFVQATWLIVANSKVIPSET